MQERRFESRTTAHKAAVKLRAEKSDRLVLACASCPETKPLKRKQPRVGTIARRLAERFDLPAGEVARRLASANNRYGAKHPTKLVLSEQAYEYEEAGE